MRRAYNQFLQNKISTYFFFCVFHILNVVEWHGMKIARKYVCRVAHVSFSGYRTQRSTRNHFRHLNSQLNGIVQLFQNSITISGSAHRHTLFCILYQRTSYDWYWTQRSNYTIIAVNRFILKRAQNCRWYSRMTRNRIGIEETMESICSILNEIN